MTGARSETGLTATTGALAGVAAVLLVVLGVVGIQMGIGSDDTDDASAEPTAEGTTMSTSPEAGSAPTPAGSSPEDEAWVAEAVRAAKDGFPAFVPARTPGGWTVDAAAYTEGESWSMELTTSSGDVVVIEQRADDDVEALVSELLGSANQTGTVNLRRWGTGTWSAYEVDESFALGQDLAGTAVVVTGPVRADVVKVTKQLLTAEMVVNVGDGSDG